jgi:dihydrodiol dehydrogenase / D-xylose 1-dehydrogenase (NADP)
VHLPAVRHGPIQWGIFGTGKIAHVFAQDFAHVRDGRLAAIASRDRERARNFAHRFRIPRFYGSYEELARDGAVDAIYVATPASAHKENALLAVNEGTAVLCEKPLTVTAREAEDLVEHARRTPIFLMEAMWTRFLPSIVKLRELLAADVIGTPLYFTADLGSDGPSDPQGRLFNPQLGGGASLHKGIFLVSLASMIFGPPNEVKSLGHLGPTAVDEQAGIVLGYPGQRLALLLCSIRARTAREAVIVGTRGTIRIHSPVICPSRLTITHHPDPEQRRRAAEASFADHIKEWLVQKGKSSRLVRWAREHVWTLGESWVHGIRTTHLYVPLLGHGLHYQVSEVNRCLHQGRSESAIMPLHQSLIDMQTMDRVREQFDGRDLPPFRPS